MKYIRTKDGIIIKAKAVEYDLVNEDDTFIQHRRDFIDILRRTIPQERVLKEADKLDKVLEIIKEKVSDINWFKCCSSLGRYNASVPSYKQLTQEEYEILKEELL